MCSLKAAQLYIYISVQNCGIKQHPHQHIIARGTLALPLDLDYEGSNRTLSQKIIKNKIFHTENTVTNRFFNYKENGIKNFELAQKLIGLISNVI